MRELVLFVSVEQTERVGGCRCLVDGRLGEMQRER